MPRKVKVPALPQVPKGLKKDLSVFLQAIKSVIDLREGHTNKRKDSRFVRVEELTGVIKKVSNTVTNSFVYPLNKQTQKEIAILEMWVSSIDMLPAVTDGCSEALAEYTTYGITRQYMSFPSSGTTYLNFQAVVPTGYDGKGFEITLYFTTATGASQGDTMTWGVKAVAHNDGDVIDLDWGAAETEIVTISGDGEQHIVTFQNPIQIGGAKPGALIDISVYRSI